MKLLLKSNDYYYFEGSDGVHFITVLLSKSNGRLDIFDLSDYDLIEFKDFKINSPIKQPDGSEFPLIQIKGDVKIVKKSNTKVGNPVRFTKNSIISHSLSYPAFNEEEIKKLPGGHTKYRPNTKYSVLHTYYCTDDLKSFTLTECDAKLTEYIFIYLRNSLF